MAAVVPSMMLTLRSKGFLAGKPLTRSAHPVHPAPAASRQMVTCVAAKPDSKKLAGVSSLPSAEGRVFNFAAGPAILPLEVLQTAQADLLNWQGSGMSVMEMSHRGKEFESIIAKAEADLRKLLNIPDNYHVLFLQGGASTQFSSVPLNLAATKDTVVDYVVSGSWSSKAAKEAKKYAKVNIALDLKDTKFTTLKPVSEWKLSKDAAYVHICHNETIEGVEFKDDPVMPTGAALVADMSSNFCSKPVDVSKYGVIYAGAQKNIGPAGVTIVIVRNDLVGKARAETPVMLDWNTHVPDKSLYNTPPAFTIYMCGLVFDYLLRNGGLAAAKERNEKKAKILYDAIQASNGFYKCPVDAKVRSLMNVPFTLANPDLDKPFLAAAEAHKLVQLKGHRSVGGMRASIYNSMPLEGVERLVQLMDAFRKAHS
eukprot:jgi/Mesvir1/2025/Mv16549-RA.1